MVLKTLAELPPTTKTLPDESVAIQDAPESVFPPPSPVALMISVMTPPGVILKQVYNNFIILFHICHISRK